MLTIDRVQFLSKNFRVFFVFSGKYFFNKKTNYSEMASLFLGLDFEVLIFSRMNSPFISNQTIFLHRILLTYTHKKMERYIESIFLKKF